MLTHAGPTVVVGTRTRGTRVSSCSLKFRTVSFPQYGFTGIPPRPSPPRSGSSVHPRAAYTRFKLRSRKRATSRSGTCVQAAVSSSDRTLPSRGPWLARRSCCPAGLRLTMTSSETLVPSRRLMPSPPGRTWAERFPNLLCLSLSPVPSSVPRDCAWLFLRRPLWPSPSLQWVGICISPRAPVPTWPCNEATKFASC
jgi:hypothetical protein